VTIVSQEEVDSTNPSAAKSMVGAQYGDPEKTPLSAEVTASPKAYDFAVTK